MSLRFVTYLKSRVVYKVQRSLAHNFVNPSKNLNENNDVIIIQKMKRREDLRSKAKQKAVSLAAPPPPPPLPPPPPSGISGEEIKTHTKKSLCTLFYNVLAF